MYKKFIDAKSLRIRFDKVDGVIKTYDGIRYLELPDSYNKVCYRINSRIYNVMFDRINYLISKKSGDKYSINNNFAKIKTDSQNSLPIEKKIGFSYFIKCYNTY